MVSSSFRVPSALVFTATLSVSFAISSTPMVIVFSKLAFVSPV